MKELKTTKLKLWQVGLASTLLVAACSAILAPQTEDFFAQPKPDGSLKTILSSPDAFEGKSITVEGYEQCRFEGNALNVSKHANPTGDKQQLCLAIDERNTTCWSKFKKCANQLVRMTGTFSHAPTGNAHYRPYWLANITSIEQVGPK